MAGGANSNLGRAFLQQSGMLGQPSDGGVAPTAPRAGASYTPAEANQYIPAFSSQQSRAQMADSPLLAQLKAQQADPLVQFGLRQTMPSSVQYGLPALMQAQMMAPQNPVQFRAQALNYRPDMQAVQYNLRRVKPSVYKTELDSARARIAELEGQLNQSPSGEGSGGG